MEEVAAEGVDALDDALAVEVEVVAAAVVVVVVVVAEVAAVVVVVAWFGLLVEVLSTTQRWTTKVVPFGVASLGGAVATPRDVILQED